MAYISRDDLTCQGKPKTLWNDQECALHVLSNLIVSPLKVTVHISILMSVAFCWNCPLLHRKEEGRLCPSPAPFGKVYVGMSVLSGSPANTTFSTFVFLSLIHTSERKTRLRKSVMIRTSEPVELLPYLCVTSKVNRALLIWGGLILFSFFVLRNIFSVWS